VILALVVLAAAACTSDVTGRPSALPVTAAPDLCAVVPDRLVEAALGEPDRRLARSEASCRWFGTREGRYVAVSLDRVDATSRLESLRQLPGAMRISDLGEGGVALDAASECGCSQVGGVALYVLDRDRLVHVSVPDGGGNSGTLANAKAVASAVLSGAPGTGS
jgi:hypothetical protein